MDDDYSELINKTISSLDFVPEFEQISTPTPENKGIYSKRFEKALLKYKKIIMLRAKKFLEIVELPLLELTQYRIVTTHSFNAISVIYGISSVYEISEIIFSLFRMNTKSTKIITEFAETSELPVYVLLSRWFCSNKNYQDWTRKIIEREKLIPGLSIGFADSHTKICLIKTKCGKHIVFEGSGNLSANDKIEQYLIEDNKESYLFHRGWILDEIKNWKEKCE